jgi:hypothetical protein
MVLYDIINKNIKRFALLNEPLPYTLDVSLKIMWLGEQGNHLEVEIKENKEKLGWLYSDASMVFYSCNGDTYICMLSDLKKVSEEVFQSKQYTTEPTIGKLCRDQATLRVSGIIPIEKVKEVSTKLNSKL